MKIMHVVTGFDIDFPGGITNYVRTLAASQVSDGHEVWIMDGGSSTRHHESGFTAIGFQGNIRPFVVSMKDDNPGTAALFDAVSSVNPAVVHFHLTVGLGVDFYESFLNGGIPYIVSLHDYYLICPRITMMDANGKNCGGPETKKCQRCIGHFDQVDLLYRVARRTNIPLPRMASSKVTRRNDRIHAFLRGSRRILPVSGKVAEIFSTVFPDLDYTVSHIGSSSALAQRPLKTASSKTRLTFMGVLSEHKGAEILITLAEQTIREDVEFHFYGRADSKWEKRAREVGVHIHGPFTPADLPSIMASTDVGLVLPIWEDNGPQVAMEFVNYGVPVIGTKMGGVPDFVSEGQGLLFDPHSEDGIAEAISFIEDLDKEYLESSGSSFPRLTSPHEHQRSLSEIYADALASGY